jgi:hypothetical protein
MYVCACSSRVVLPGGQGGPDVTQGLLPPPQVSWFALALLYPDMLSRQHIALLCFHRISMLCNVLVCAGDGRSTAVGGDSGLSVAVSVLKGCPLPLSPCLLPQSLWMSWLAVGLLRPWIQQEPHVTDAYF